MAMNFESSCGFLFFHPYYYGGYQYITKILIKTDFSTLVKLNDNVYW